MMMKAYQYFVVFSIDEDKFAIRYERVVKAAMSVEITPLPYSSKRTLGIINFHGKIVPVVNIRRHLRKKEKPIALSDSLIFISNEDGMLFAFLVDAVHQPLRPDKEYVTEMSDILPNYKLYEGTIRINDKVIPIINTEKIMSPKEKEKIEKANLQ